MSIYNGLLGGGMYQRSIKRNVFISYYHGDQYAVNEFVRVFGRELNVFTPCMLAEGQRFTDDIINSTNPAYVMQQIRNRYFGHSTVTIVLLGNCTHSRRYVDWEIKASLQRGGVGGQLPHGLMAINLCKMNSTKFIPPRFAANWNQDNVDCYAPFYRYPNSADELRGWIEEAYRSRTERSHLISNASEMMKNNSVCNVCGVTH
ncbi:TIR domain-containing protein [Vibrio sp. McD22-P3]|uniref:TIR domain-containing protein n=1 Tax=Vibrio sp. McD22-P3 TaxID=2724880 RepID=UPI001F3A7753|nr:TIR domain-containing protein [Vibrio sp. McD22-P3]MCF4171932.1 TIR domain-containing protein [Vibrio sp. McD22-P3]